MLINNKHSCASIHFDQDTVKFGDNIRRPSTHENESCNKNSVNGKAQISRVKIFRSSLTLSEAISELSAHSEPFSTDEASIVLSKTVLHNT